LLLFDEFQPSARVAERAALMVLVTAWLRRSGRSFTPNTAWTLWQMSPTALELKALEPLRAYSSRFRKIRWFSSASPGQRWGYPCLKSPTQRVLRPGTGAVQVRWRCNAATALQASSTAGKSTRRSVPIGLIVRHRRPAALLTYWRGLSFRTACWRTAARAIAMWPRTGGCSRPFARRKSHAWSLVKIASRREARAFEPFPAQTDASRPVGRAVYEQQMLAIARTYDRAGNYVARRSPARAWFRCFGLRRFAMRHRGMTLLDGRAEPAAYGRALTACWCLLRVADPLRRPDGTQSR
jgi:hypothetical protein